MQVVILGREAGLGIELDDVPVASLVPKQLEDVSVDEYMQKLSDSDRDMDARAKAAADKVRRTLFLQCALGFMQGA